MLTNQGSIVFPKSSTSPRQKQTDKITPKPDIIKLLKTKEIKYRVITQSSYSVSWYILKRAESRVLLKYLYIHVYSGTLHNRQKVETTQIYIDRLLDTQYLVCT